MCKLPSLCFPIKTCFVAKPKEFFIVLYISSPSVLHFDEKRRGIRLWRGHKGLHDTINRPREKATASRTSTDQLFKRYSPVAAACLDSLVKEILLPKAVTSVVNNLLVYLLSSSVVLEKTRWII